MKNMSAAEEYLYLLSTTFFDCLTKLSELELAREAVKPQPSEEQLEQLLSSVPFAIGAEYINKDWILHIFEKLTRVFAREITAYEGIVAMYLAENTQQLHIPERIFFHLVEQKDEFYPFAFLATYATKEDCGKIRHMSLKYALTEYKEDKSKLLALLSCLNRAFEVSPLICGFVESGEMFHPLRLTAAEDYKFLKDAEAIEKTGILCRILNWWKKKSMSLFMSVNLGEERPSFLGFGACLADDMGLGKTVQVLAYLENMRENNKDARVLLIVPASLIGNWQKEAEKFSPKMDLLILHGKTAPALNTYFEENKAFLTITTYGMAARIKALKETEWDCIVLDEAQVIKNPTTKQTRAIKEISSKGKIAVTGTPIENNLTNLWSLFDLLNKGLLGTSKEFKEYCKRLSDNPQGYQRLKTMISPFMLRRLKTDKTVIADLPDKIESIDYVSLSKKQVVLYRRAVAETEEKMNETVGIARKGIILSTIMKLKQICNHPDQYLGQNNFSADDSGKLQLLRGICSTIYEKRERVIVFTQFKEITEQLADFLKTVFGCEGFVLHGGTSVKKRNEIVEVQYILNDLCLNIEKGEFICVLGKSGCGKSTLLNCLAGYLKPDKGSITVSGAEIHGPGPERGVVFQQHALFPWRTVSGDCMVHKRIYKQYYQSGGNLS